MKKGILIKSLLENRQYAERIISLFRRKVEEKSGVIVEESDEGVTDIIIKVSSDIKDEGYDIADGEGGQVIVTGGCNLGVLYGLGSFYSHRKL